MISSLPVGGYSLKFTSSTSLGQDHHRVVAALGGAGWGRLVAIVGGAVAGGPGRVAEGGAVGKIDRAGHGLLRFVGEVLSVGDLLDGRVADAGMPVGRGAVLQVGEVDVFALSAGAFIGGDDLVEVPAVVVATAAGVGPVLQGVAVAAELVEGATFIVDVEAGLAVVAGDLVDAQVGHMFGQVEIGLGIGHQAVADVTYAAEKVPGVGAGAAAGILLGGDGANGERPAIAGGAARGGGTGALVGVAAGVGQDELGHEVARVGRDQQRVAQAELAGVALLACHERHGWALVGRVATNAQGARSQDTALASQSPGRGVIDHRGDESGGGLFGGASSHQKGGPAQVERAGVEIQGIQLRGLVVYLRSLICLLLAGHKTDGPTFLSAGARRDGAVL